MILSLTVLWLAGAAPTKPLFADVPRDVPRKDATTRLTPVKRADHAGGITRCGVCHTTEGWKGARFAHDRTGFPLRGRHAETGCPLCHHPDINTAQPRACSGCHEDAHAGDLGLRCEGCHDERSWKPLFDTDAHRRTAFPLVGRHAALPCAECHLQARDRRFSGNTVSCIGCHQPDYARTAVVGLPHAALGFGTRCTDCHTAWAWRPARLPQHDQCFQISAGPHAGISCTQCHTSFPAIAFTGTCSTMTAACTACHEHSCAKADQDHQGVPGYQCKDRKCYECHRFSGGP